MSANGRLAAGELSAIPGGRLEHEAARAWNAMNKAAGGGLRPLGSQSSYRDFAGQQYFWDLYTSGRGNLAARPGTSNHGWGRAVDLAAPWMRSWIDRYGHRYGWRKVEAPSEWWHVNYVGGFEPEPDPLRALGKKQRRAAARLLFHRRRANAEAATGLGRKYRKAVRWREFWRNRVLKLYGRASGERKAVLGRVLKDRDGDI